MEHYLKHTDYPIWEVIQKGNGHVQVSTNTHGQIKVCLLKLLKRFWQERERKAKTTLLMAIPEDHLAKFYKMTDDKEMWEAIKSRFGVSIEDDNRKFLRSLPSSWSQVSLIIRTKPRVDTLNFDDLYNNLRVFKSNVKGGYDFYKTEEVLKKIGQKLHFDAKEPVGFDKSKVEYFNCHNTRHFARECRSKGNQDNRRRDAGNTRYKARDNEKRHAKQDEHKAMVTVDG
nr:hypothetical protein [Tanacetum cinerariifolium]